MSYPRTLFGTGTFRTRRTMARPQTGSNKSRLISYSGLRGKTLGESKPSTPKEQKKNKDKRKKEDEEKKKAEEEKRKEEEGQLAKQKDDEKPPQVNYEEGGGADVAQEEGDVEDKAPLGSGEGWHLYYNQPVYEEKEDEQGNITLEHVRDDKFVLEEDEEAPFKITAVNDMGSVKLPTHPLENGMVKHDHKVRNPKTLRITGMVKRANSKNMDNLLRLATVEKSLGSYFHLDSPWKTRTKMYLSRFSSRANTQKYDVFEYTIDLTELLIAKSKTDKTDHPGLASTNNKGAQGAKP